MNIVTKPLPFVLLMLLTLGTLALTAAVPSSSAGKNSVYYLDYNGQAEQRPENIFFTANSGPRVLDIDWKKWNKRTTTGKGTYYSNCICPEERQGPARLTLRRPVKCVPEFGERKGDRIRVYRKGIMRTNINGEKKKTKIETGRGVCR